MDHDRILQACQDGNLETLQEMIENGGTALSNMSASEQEELLPSISNMLERAVEGHHLHILKYLEPIYPQKFTTSSSKQSALAL